MSTPMLGGWVREPDPVDETEFTPWARAGWNSWNGQSPEVEVCLFVQQLVNMMEPSLVLETGVGQGYMTRAIVSMLDDHQKLICYESDVRWREALWNLPFWNENRFNVSLSVYECPSARLLGGADLCIFDSEWEVRFDEIETWNGSAKPGSVAIIHDTGDQPDTIHASLRELIGDLGMTGVFLKNPRGCFMAVQSKEE